MMIPTSARLRFTELTPARCHRRVMTGCGASSGNSPRCAASCCTHQVQSLFPKENPASLRPQLEQLATVKGVSQEAVVGTRRSASHPDQANEPAILRSSFSWLKGKGFEHGGHGRIRREEPKAHTRIGWMIVW